MLDFELEKKWQKALDFFQEQHGPMDVSSVLFLIGIQEIGRGFMKLTKDKKLEVIHVGVCTVLEPYGYYVFLGKDKDGWPHFENNQKLPALNSAEQQNMLKEAIVTYFDNEKIF